MRNAFAVTLAVLAACSAVPAASAAGSKVVFASNRSDGARDLYVVNADGSGEHRITFDGNAVFERLPVWSPDASRIAFAGRVDGNWDIYTVAADGGDLRRVTTDPARDDYPRWTADGRLVFERGGFDCPCRAWIANTDGSEAHVIPLVGNVTTPTPAPRGQRLVYASDAGGSLSLHVAQLNGKGDRRISEGPAAFGDFDAVWSPDGNELAFLRDHTGLDNDLYVMHANGTGIRQLTDTPDRVEFSPSWSADGSEILFGADGGLFAVAADGSSERAVETSPSAPLVESLDRGARDASLWHQVGDPGSSIRVQDGSLVASISGAASPGGPWNQIDTHWGSQCRLEGDFDYQVDYQLLTWSQHSGYFATLNGFFADGSIARTSTPWDGPYGEQYSAWANITVPFVSNSVNTTDLAGSMRLVRTGGTLHAYARSPGGGWTLVLSTPGVTGATVYGMGLSVQAWDFAHLDGSVAYDDFRLSSGALSCPGWWQDYFPDVSR